MQKKFNVEFTFTIDGIVPIEASTAEEALQKANQLLKGGLPQQNVEQTYGEGEVQFITEVKEGNKK